MRIWLGIVSLLLLFTSCAKDRPFLSGHIKRAHDAVMVNCDPYGLNKVHTCLLFSTAFRDTIYAYDATAGEMVLADMSYLPLKIRGTGDLVAVMSSDARTPFAFALDHSKGHVYPVRLFGDDKSKIFASQKPSKLSKPAFKMAAIDRANKIIGVLTYPRDGEVHLVAFDRTTGALDNSVAPRVIKVGKNPNYVEIDREGRFAVISDEKEGKIHVLDLSTVDDVLTKGVAHKLTSFDVKLPVDRIYLSKRDFGYGVQLYAVMLSSLGNTISLATIDGAKIEHSLELDDYPMAAYFPDDKSATCCNKESNWFNTVNIKGVLTYVVISKASTGLTLEKSTTADLTSVNNLALGKLHVRKILGGAIEQDASIDREPLCSNHRQTFYVSSYGNSRSYLHREPTEQEAHAYACEGEASATLFGDRIE